MNVIRLVGNILLINESFRLTPEYYSDSKKMKSLEKSLFFEIPVIERTPNECNV